LHADELPIDEPLVRALLRRTLPDAAGQPLRRLAATGSSNALYRLGVDLLVRLPRQPGGSAAIDKEARWTPYLAGRLPVQVPEIVAVGEPAAGYPERWSVTRWLDGEPVTAAAAAAMSASRRAQLAEDLAGIVLALRAVPVPSRALRDPELHWYRAGSLRDIAADTADNLARCRRMALDLDLDAAERLWTAATARPEPSAPGPPRWVHADLLGENLLLHEGRLSAVLDFGGLAVGDPTVDLICAWELLDAPARRVLRDRVDVPDDVWQRGRAWALAIALMTFPYYARTMPQRCADRLVMAREAIRGD
jgi:aminoglycoside phosphotransferase (APT) family kinase protein